MTPNRQFFLRGETIDLTLLTVDDAPTMAVWMNNHHITQYLSAGSWPTSLTQEVKWIESLSNRESSLTLGIWRKADQKLIGSCGLHDIDQLQQHAELGIVIGEPDYWNGGVGTEAVNLLCTHGFEWLNLRHVWLRVLGNNPYAKLCYERCGFTEVGCFPSFVFNDGEWHDETLMLARNPSYK